MVIGVLLILDLYSTRRGCARQYTYADDPDQVCPRAVKQKNNGVGSQADLKKEDSVERDKANNGVRDAKPGGESKIWEDLE